MYRKINDDLAERTREVWDDEEDIQAAVERMGLDKQQHVGDSGPLLSEVNKLYVTKDFSQAYIAQQLELRYMEGPPGQPPRLEQLIRHVSNSCYNASQTAVLQSLCSLPALDEEHAQRQQRRQQQVQQDRLLRAAAEVEEASAGPGVPVSSLPLSQSAALKRMQQQLRAEGRLGWDDDEALHDDEDEDGGPWGDASDAGTSSSSSSKQRVGRSLVRAASSSAERRRTPDLLELMQCTSAAAAGDGSRAGTAAAAAAPAAGMFNASRSSRGGRGGRSGAEAATGSLSTARRLDMQPERLTALVCRNALAELSQDLPVCSSRGDRPASVTGLWPLLTAFNHSCAANAVAVLAGGVPAAVEQQGQQRLLASQQQQQQQQAAAATAAQLRRAAAGGRSSGRPAGPAALSEMSPGDEVTLDYLGPGVEGSLVQPERRQAALLQRWGFRCRCERCSGEASLGRGVQATQQAANALAARLGPQVSAAIVAGDAAALAAAAGPLRGVVRQLEQQVDVPTVQPRLAAWAHASIYQAHSLLAAVRMAVAPGALNSLATIGTAMELAGTAAPGGASHLLGAACLLVSSQQAWHDEDARVEAAAGGLLQVVQLRYGAVQARVAERLMASSQQWALQLSATRLGLVAPAAAAATRARLALAAADAAPAANKQPGVADTSAAAAAAGRGSSGVRAEDDEEDVDEIANALELQADEVLEVTDEMLDDVYDDADGDSSSSQSGMLPDEVLVQQRSAEEVRQGLELYAGYAAALQPDQGQMLERRQRQQQQQQQREQGMSVSTAAGSTAGRTAGELVLDVDDADVDVSEMPLAAWLQEGPAADGNLPEQQQQPLAAAAASAASAIPNTAAAAAAAAAAVTVSSAHEK
ncbi:hypothetical protein COO60DRAFT_1635410 [Scenedesmus sp. NREL 46B-D3]|nr:hypothetical protein COO60DRAFT_1635410 [Scenedesmus sp. NREL 46B-D3]